MITSSDSQTRRSEDEVRNGLRHQCGTPRYHVSERSLNAGRSGRTSGSASRPDRRTCVETNWPFMLVCEDCLPIGAGVRSDDRRSAQMAQVVVRVVRQGGGSTATRPAIDSHPSTAKIAAAFGGDAGALSTRGRVRLQGGRRSDSPIYSVRRGGRGGLPDHGSHSQSRRRPSGSSYALASATMWRAMRSGRSRSTASLRFHELVARRAPTNVSRVSGITTRTDRSLSGDRQTSRRQATATRAAITDALNELRQRDPQPIGPRRWNEERR